ncbi:sugar phosphate isomerase/epimerase [Roseiconus nitratireducens]|uniref:Sugar phosphate isomerase/epimerase n=1 Tax=Roseiconus nitratireducens TaxID=2605748 RepID=A0A5M6D1S1_9BACT|nr:sugar phosphate isomerase/epimerase family protein [Roseiconus nitratireducens]KAA5540242.1 sugar phosphate isomerase/epimerase [Roseiconus nitratireducens]
MTTLSVSQLSTLRWDLESEVIAYAKHGFSGIGLYRPKLEDYGVDRAIELLAEHSMAVTSLSWVGGFTGSDGRTYEDAVQDAIKAVIQAAELNADTLIVLAGGKNNHIQTHLRRTLCQALCRLAAVACEHGIQLALEPYHPGCGDEWSFVNDLQSTLDIIERVGNPALGLVLDTYHVGMDEGAMHWLPDVAPHIHLVQLGDGRHCPHGEMNRCLLGDGCVPLGRLMEMLHEQGYRGAWEVELIGEDVETIGYEQLLDHTKRYLDRTFAGLC